VMSLTMRLYQPGGPPNGQNGISGKENACASNVANNSGMDSQRCMVVRYHS